MALPNFVGVTLPYDPIIDAILHDARTDKAFKRSIHGMRDTIIAYRCTLHPSDQLLDAWYRFKENRPCQR